MSKKETNLFIEKQQEIKAYKRRWFILLIFIIYSALNSYQWVEYTIISNIVTRYYNVDSGIVDWTSIVYMAMYPLFVLPATFILDSKGLRMAALYGAIGTGIGTAIKIFSIPQETFWLVLVGQTILSISQIFISFLPPKIAVVWFKETEISTVCALGVFGTQLGVALGFVLPPILVQNYDNLEDIVPGLKWLVWGLAAVAVPSALAVVFYFPDKPPKAPNVVQLEEHNNIEKFEIKSFFSTLKLLVKNCGFLIYVLAYGIIVGVFSAFGTLLNHFILEYFPNSAEDAGRMGLVMVLCGIVGSILFGVFLDKTHKFKETTFATSLLTTISVAAFMFALEMKSKVWVYISIGAVGYHILLKRIPIPVLMLGNFSVFVGAYVPVGFEMGIELTYPCCEGTATGVLLTPSQIFGGIFSVVSGRLIIMVGTFWAIAILAILSAFGTIITFFIPNELRRQEAIKNRAHCVVPPD